MHPILEASHVQALNRLASYEAVAQILEYAVFLQQEEARLQRERERAELRAYVAERQQQHAE